MKNAGAQDIVAVNLPCRVARGGGGWGGGSSREGSRGGRPDFSRKGRPGTSLRTWLWGPRRASPLLPSLYPGPARPGCLRPTLETHHGTGQGRRRTGSGQTLRRHDANRPKKNERLYLLTRLSLRTPLRATFLDGPRMRTETLLPKRMSRVLFRTAPWVRCASGSERDCGFRSVPTVSDGLGQRLLAHEDHFLSEKEGQR